MTDARNAMAGVVNTPAYVLDESRLLHNLEILKGVQERTGCKILLAQKAFSMFSVYPMIAKYLAGTTASGLFEAKLGREEFEGEVHVFSPAYKYEDICEIVDVSDHIVFNSLRQLRKFGGMCRSAGKSSNRRNGHLQRKRRAEGSPPYRSECALIPSL